MQHSEFGSIPVLEKLDVESWQKFKTDFQSYVSRGGVREMRALMVPDVVLLVKIQLDIADNAQLSDDDNALMRQVDTLYAPRNAADAVKRLEEIKLMVNTSEGVGEYCKKFLRVHAEITQMNVAEATQVKKFLSNMRWADVRRYVEAINPATVKAAVKAALEAARSVPPDVPKGPQPQGSVGGVPKTPTKHNNCLLYTSDAADE